MLGVILFTSCDQPTDTDTGTVKVSYNSNGAEGGSVPVDNTQYTVGTAITVLANVNGLSKADYTFNGWNTAADGSGAAYTAGASFEISTNITLYAQWEKTGDGSKTYRVTYDMNGAASGNVPVDSASYASNAKVTVLDNVNGLSKADYTFNGWNTAADGSGTAYAAGAELTISDDITLYAQWAVIGVETCTITYNANGGNGTIDPRIKVKGSPITLSDGTGFTKKDHLFSGWGTSADGSVVYTGKSSYTADENITLYAVWTAKYTDMSWSYPDQRPNLTWTGSGSEEDPFIITTAQQLADLSYMVNSKSDTYEDEYFILGRDIDLNKNCTVDKEDPLFRPWVVIGSPAALFAGTFDGMGFKITGLYVNGGTDDDCWIGLFGNLSGIVKNLTMGQGYICGSFAAEQAPCFGGVVACTDGSAAVYNCYNYIDINVRTEKAECFAGGIVGHLFNGGAVNCANYGNISAIAKKNDCKAGGITGYAEVHGRDRLSNLYNHGNISAVSERTASNSFAGGIVGYLKKEFENSYSIGTVAAKFAGGIAGFVEGDGIESSVNTSYALGSNCGETLCGGTQNSSGVSGTLLTDKDSLISKVTVYGKEYEGSLLNVLNTWVENYSSVLNPDQYSSWKLGEDGWPVFD